jgi:hypothetical protein
MEYGELGVTFHELLTSALGCVKQSTLRLYLRIEKHKILCGLQRYFDPSTLERNSKDFRRIKLRLFVKYHIF